MWNSRSPAVAGAVCTVAGEPRERVQVGRLGVSEQPVPEARADADDAGQLALGDPEADRALERADVGEQLAHSLLATRLDRQDQEDRRLGERGQDRWL